jgi:dTDP-4-amino-4,6-dideoxygalactose transaminase
MPDLERPGEQVPDHTHWVFPVLHGAPDELVRHLWAAGFDATRGASSMYVVEPPAGRAGAAAAEATRAFARMLYLPAHEGTSRRDLERLARAVNGFGTRAGRTAPGSQPTG